MSGEPEEELEFYPLPLDADEVIGLPSIERADVVEEVD